MNHATNGRICPEILGQGSTDSGIYFMFTGFRNRCLRLFKCWCSWLASELAGCHIAGLQLGRGGRLALLPL